jgi:hypothetical protein
MGSLKRRVESLEANRKGGQVRLSRQALTYLSDEDLDALEAVLLTISKAINGADDGTTARYRQP